MRFGIHWLGKGGAELHVLFHLHAIAHNVKGFGKHVEVATDTGELFREECGGEIFVLRDLFHFPANHLEQQFVDLVIDDKHHLVR